jgi:hypothetical protein
LEQVFRTMSAKTAQEQMDPIIHDRYSCGKFRTEDRLWRVRASDKRTAGKALLRSDLGPEVIARFHSKYQQDDAAMCWLWRGARTSAGYGSFGIVALKHHEVTRPAHRVAYVMAHGDLPAGVLVMHSCDTPLCVNPAHLSLGTDADNVRDAISKGRMRGQRVVA